MSKAKNILGDSFAKKTSGFKIVLLYLFRTSEIPDYSGLKITFYDLFILLSKVYVTQIFTSDKSGHLKQIAEINFLSMFPNLRILINKAGIIDYSHL